GWAPACTTEPGTTTRRTRPTSRSCTTPKATSSASAETQPRTQARNRAAHTDAHGYLLRHLADRANVACCGTSSVSPLTCVELGRFFNLAPSAGQGWRVVAKEVSSRVER